MKFLRRLQKKICREFNHYTYTHSQCMMFLAEHTRTFRKDYIEIRLPNKACYWFHKDDIYFENYKQKKFKRKKERVFISRALLEEKRINQRHLYPVLYRR